MTSDDQKKEFIRLVRIEFPDTSLKEIFSTAASLSPTLDKRAYTTGEIAALVIERLKETT